MWNTADRFWTSALAAALAVVVATAGPPASPAAPRPPVPSRATPAPADACEAPDCAPRLGLLPSDDAAVTAALVEGILRALDESRSSGGPDLALVVGDARSGWSSVASEAVRLACEERVVALVAPPERALAHPVAQAATRCGVPVASTSGAASVTAAGSRWVLAVVPCGAAPDPRDAGYDAARLFVGAVHRAGLRRAAVLAAARDATPVPGAAGAFVIGRSGRRGPVAR